MSPSSQIDTKSLTKQKKMALYESKQPREK
jgi:hypothetical protein